MGKWIINGLDRKGPFKILFNRKYSKLPGNSREYSSEKLKKVEGTILEGKNILFLGSSVTEGLFSLEDAIPEYFEKRFGVNSYKEAVSGTTLVNKDKNSYISRMKKAKYDKIKFDLVICQLSTNDASLGMPLGELDDCREADKLDTMTITGAMEYVVAYSQNKWNCSVFFYTGARFDHDGYKSMVNRLFEISSKWDIEIIDLWNNDEFNNISNDERNLYMNDPVHPLRAGYMKWWCPEMEKQLLELLEKKS